MRDVIDVTASPSPLRLVSVSKSFDGTVAMEGVSLALDPGEFVAVLGASGAGKSTILRVAAGLVAPDRGQVEVLGQSVARLGRAERRRLLQRVGLVYQQFNLVGRLSCIENVLIGRLAHTPAWRVLLRRFTHADRQTALAALDRVGLLAQAYQRADTLSGGQQQRVAIARVLAQKADLILADEPVSSLDPQTAVNVLELLREIGRERDIAVLYVLHQVDLARRFADRIVALRSGRVVLDTPAPEFGEEAFRAVFQSAALGSARGNGLAGDHIEDFGARLDRSLDCA